MAFPAASSPCAAPRAAVLAAVAVVLLGRPGARAGALLLREAPLAEAAPEPRSFEAFLQLHGRNYVQGSEEFEHRRALFHKSVEQVERQNSRPNRLWTAAVTKFADHTSEELAALRGYSRQARPSASAGGAGKVQLLSRATRTVSLKKLPQDFTWRSRLKATSEVRNQKSCGSCWAFASSTVLWAHSELYQQDRSCSIEQIVSCTPNPHHCGGDGGCKGATAELGMDYVVRNGCLSNADWNYKAASDPKQCPAAEAAFAQRLAVADTAAARRSSSYGLYESHAAIAASDTGKRAGLSMGLTGYTRLPENQLAPVLLALVEKGPIAVSVSVGPVWHLYKSGIMDGCDRDAIINHAVTLVGFGVGREGAELGQHYWQIQNSWGPEWGEGGFVRMARQDNEGEAQYCGTDRKPEQGSGCAGGPSEVKICGTCGILYDTVVPEFDLGPDGLWSNDAFLQQQHNLTKNRSRPSSFLELNGKRRRNPWR